MPIEQLRDMLRRRPFQPFRIYLTDGSHYDVTHPEAIILAARSVAVGVGGGATQNGPLPDYIAHLALIHITRLEPLDAPAQA